MTGGTFWRIRTKENADMLHEFLLRQVSDGKDMLLREEETTRTTRQNNALHAVLRRLAKGLNAAGHTVKHPFKPELELPWTENLCKETLMRPIITAMYGKESTTRLSRKELSEATEVMLSRIADLTGVYVDGLEGEE